MDAKKYPRTLRKSLHIALSDTPVVCLLGSRQCGKSTLAQMLEEDRGYFTFDDGNILAFAQTDPKGFLETLPPRVTLDEIQRAPELLPAIKQSVDNDRRPGRFLLTGSANLLLLPEVSESLAGRIEFVYLHPLSESEIEQNQGLFIQDLTEGRLKPSITPHRPLEIDALPERVIRGGYPEPLARTELRARQWHRQYLKSIIERDIQDVAKIKDGHEVSRLLEFLAPQTGALLNTNNTAKSLTLDRGTIDRYLLVLERLFLIRRLPAWHRNSAKRLVKTAKIHLTDSGLASTLSGFTSKDWNLKRDQMGHLLESFVVQQVIAQAGWTDPDLQFWHYRDKDKVEVDLVITKGAKVWGIEIKASSTVRPGDARGLRRLAGQCGTDFQSGILLYNGHDALPLGGSNGFLAVPISKLWTL